MNGELIDVANSVEGQWKAAAGRTDGAQRSEHRPPAAPAPTPETDPLNLAVSVTRQVQITGPTAWDFLVCGIDTLDLGLYVNWHQWDRLGDELAKGKQAAERTGGILWDWKTESPTIIVPSGKPPMYAFHIQTAGFHLFIARRDRFSEKYPNVYASISAKTIWLRGLADAVAGVLRYVTELGGQIERTQVSRVDLCADFKIPGGLSLDFVRAFRVSRSTDTVHYLNGDKLETFYVGGLGAAIRARIYDKGLLVSQDPLSAWFVYEVWKTATWVDIWRLEYQLRREVLAQMGINSVADLLERAAGLWKYLTDDWLSLRYPETANQTRRTVHPWWQAVQEVGSDLGGSGDVKRDYSAGGRAVADWFVSHAAGCLPGYAARTGMGDFEAAFAAFTWELKKYWMGDRFGIRYRVERIKLGMGDEPEVGEP